MKLWLLLACCAVAAAAARLDIEDAIETNALQNDQIDNHNLIVNQLIRQMFEILRRVMRNGSSVAGIPPLDPMDLVGFHLIVPAGLLNLDLQLKGIHMSGMSDFVVHRSNMRFSDLTFNLEMSIPRLLIRADLYDLDGDLFGAIPLYGKGGAEFVVENLRFRALLYLKQSEDGKSVLIDRVENASFEIPSFKSNIDGVIGGGDIDAIVNAVIEEVIIDYVNRFQGAIAKVAAGFAVQHANPILDLLDTWKYIRPFVPS